MPATPHPPRFARFGIGAVFFLSGAALATWVAHVPTVQAALSLTEGTLGLLLLGISAGALCAMPVTGWLIPRTGSRILTGLGAAASLGTLPLLLLAPSPALLALALFLFGLTNAVMDVAMNAQAIACERRYGRAIMSSFHGLFSLGGLVGAGVSSLVLTLGAAPLEHVAGAVVLLGVVLAVSYARLLPASVDSQAIRSRFAWPSGELLALGLLAFCVLLAEGSMVDWSAVYLRTTLGTSPGTAALGFAAFSLTMTMGRFAGDHLVDRLGRVPMVRLGSAFTAVGLGTGLLIGTPVAAIVGFGCVGLGLANVVPTIYSAAGRTPNLNPGTALAAVTTTGYVGFLAGPPLIGLTADVLTLRGSLGIVVAACLLVAWQAGRVRIAEPAA